MPCPICGRNMCDHSPAERGQTQEEMSKDYLADAPKKSISPEERLRDVINDALGK